MRLFCPMWDFFMRNEWKSETMWNYVKLELLIYNIIYVTIVSIYNKLKVGF